MITHGIKFLMRTVFATGVFLVGAPGSALAAEPAPTVVELFTSQGCYSCPPAEAYLGRLSSRSDVIALEFHVDYWDDLIYGSAGKWKDPFSSSVHTQRQRYYNHQIRNTGSVYTPQMVIGGRLEVVGSHERKVERAIQRLQATPSVPLGVNVSNAGSGTLNITVEGPLTVPAAIWMVEFHRNIETKVRSGENKGKTLVSHHIVTQMKKLGDWSGTAIALQVEAPKANSGKGCAILIQQAPGTAILGASYCPVTPST